MKKIKQDPNKKAYIIEDLGETTRLQKGSCNGDTEFVIIESLKDSKVRIIK